MKLRGVLVALVALGVVAAGLFPSHAAPPELTSADPLITWEGTVPGGIINPLLLVSPAPEVRCLVSKCDEFTVSLNLGPGFWADHPTGAVEFAVHWPYDGVIDIDLQVLKDGKVVGQSVGVDSNAESTFVPHPADGTYVVRAIPSNTFNPDNQVDTVDYRGLVQLELPQTDPPGQGHQLLPDLKPLPPDGFHVSTALNLIPFPENPLISCYPEETLQNKDSPTKCLRFNQTIANVGEGPLVFRFGLFGVLTPGQQDNIIMQRIYSSDGSYTDVQVPERYQFHKVHGHLHYKGFGQSFLYAWDSQAGRAATPTAVGKKVGFCVIDVVMQEEYWEATGNGPRAHMFPFDCIVPDEIDPSGPQLWVEQGVQVGWSDVYGWNLADQYINITGVPNGDYELVQLANPTNSMVESDPTNNCASTILHIQGDTVATVGPGNTVCPG